MVHECCVLGCDSKSNDRHQRVTLFPFPKTRCMLYMWEKLIPSKFEDNDNQTKIKKYICQKHFAISDIIQSPVSSDSESSDQKPLRLRETAVPTIFGGVSLLSKSVNGRRWSGKNASKQTLHDDPLPNIHDGPVQPICDPCDVLQLKLDIDRPTTPPESNSMPLQDALFDMSKVKVELDEDMEEEEEEEDIDSGISIKTEPEDTSCEYDNSTADFKDSDSKDFAITTDSKEDLSCNLDLDDMIPKVFQAKCLMPESLQRNLNYMAQVDLLPSKTKPETVSEPEMASQAKPVSCHFCKKSFDNKKIYQTHIVQSQCVAVSAMKEQQATFYENFKMSYRNRKQRRMLLLESQTKALGNTMRCYRRFFISNVKHLNQTSIGHNETLFNEMVAGGIHWRSTKSVVRALPIIKCKKVVIGGKVELVVSEWPNLLQENSALPIALVSRTPGFCFGNQNNVRMREDENRNSDSCKNDTDKLRSEEMVDDYGNADMMNENCAIEMVNAKRCHEEIKNEEMMNGNRKKRTRNGNFDSSGKRRNCKVDNGMKNSCDEEELTEEIGIKDVYEIGVKDEMTECPVPQRRSIRIRRACKKLADDDLLKVKTETNNEDSKLKSKVEKTELSKRGLRNLVPILKKYCSKRKRKLTEKMTSLQDYRKKQLEKKLLLKKQKDEIPRDVLEPIIKLEVDDESTTFENLRRRNKSKKMLEETNEKEIEEERITESHSVKRKALKKLSKELNSITIPRYACTFCEKVFAKERKCLSHLTKWHQESLLFINVEHSYCSFKSNLS